jgi:hypothetical protein
MKALILNSIIVIGMTMVTEGCEENKVNPCVKGIPVLTHGNCYLIIQVLNAQIGKNYSYKPPGGPAPDGFPIINYANAVSTSPTLKVNYGDTIYFRYKTRETNMNCPLTPGMPIPPDVPNIEVISYSQKNCPQ